MPAAPVQALERLREQSRELAAANLARGEEQADIRNQQAIIRSSEYAPAKAAFDEKWGRQQGVLAKLSPEVLRRRSGGGAGLGGLCAGVLVWASARAVDGMWLRCRLAGLAVPTAGGSVVVWR